MVKWCIILAVCIFQINCTNTRQQEYTEQNATTSNRNDAPVPLVRTLNEEAGFKLGFFYTLPDNISGCGEYLTYDTTEFAAGRYIFLSNLTQFALINVDGTTVSLQKDSAASKTLSADSYQAVYQGAAFKAVLILKKVKSYDEGGFYSGTLQITGKNVTRTYKVHGEAGC